MIKIYPNMILLLKNDATVFFQTNSAWHHSKLRWRASAGISWWQPCLWHLTMAVTPKGVLVRLKIRSIPIQDASNHQKSLTDFIWCPVTFDQINIDQWQRLPLMNIES